MIQLINYIDQWKPHNAAAAAVKYDSNSHRQLVKKVIADGSCI